MQSFRTELENLDNPVVEKDIIELEKKIRMFQEGKYDEEKFRSLRLARGVYGQRQAGVQMIRIKIPFGKMTAQQLHKIADISDEYASSNLHATTRQDIQIHYVSLDRTPELWAKLEQDKITLREACGNTVRNITASADAGINPNEPFDVSPYAQEMFEYFLRNPICQEMGRKFKIAFSSDESDTALTFIHDLGFIPKIKIENGKEIRGFKVLMGGGLGAIPYMAQVIHEFLEEDKIIPLTEGVLRIFDRFGERSRRQKARFKFLVKDLGTEGVLKLVAEEQKAVQFHSYPVDINKITQATPQPADKVYPKVEIVDKNKFKAWKKSNIFEQKQKGFYGVYIKLPLGDMSSDTARNLANIVREYAADDIRITINQGYLLKFVRPEAFEGLYVALDKLGMAGAGFDSTADITACPGTDTCNLGISSSTGTARALEKVIEKEYPDLVHDNNLKIKISGCPNSCGQHGIASIGFHGSSQKNGKLVLPALQVILGGGYGKNGAGFMGEKVIKIPSKRGTQAMRMLLDDYENNRQNGEYYHQYFRRQGKPYFYELLKPLNDLTSLKAEDYLDWGQEEKFEVIKAVGECAGVIIDLVATLIYETDEKMAWANEALEQKMYADAIYHAYNVFVNGAKALLLEKNEKLNTQIKVIKTFDKHFVTEGTFEFAGDSFEKYVLKMKQNEPTQAFAETYVAEATAFLDAIKDYRKDADYVQV